MKHEILFALAQRKHPRLFLDWIDIIDNDDDYVEDDDESIFLDCNGKCGACPEYGECIYTYGRVRAKSKNNLAQIIKQSFLRPAK